MKNFIMRSELPHLSAASHPDSKPKFSIIVPTHDRAELLTEAINSILDQSVSEWELIIVDDGSPNPPILPPDARIRCLRNERSLGPAAARNRGMSVATGDFIAFLDDDDTWTPDRLQHALDAHGRADVVVCGGTPSAHREGLRPNDWIADATTPPLGQTSVRRELCPTYDASFTTAEDVDWWLRLTRATDNVAFIEHDDWIWRRHDGVRHGIGTVRRIEGRKLLMSRHADYFKSHPRARAFSWRRIGLLHLALGQHGAALSATLRSLVVRPSYGAVRLFVKVGAARPVAMLRRLKAVVRKTR